MKRIVPTGILGAAILAVAASGASAAPAGSTCPEGFTWRMTFEETVQLPKFQHAFADGIFTVADLQAGFDFVDRNANGFICLKDKQGAESNSFIHEYHYVVRDDNASVP